MKPRLFLLALSVSFVCLFATQSVAEPLVYEGESGFGKGKHIVFWANDHEYRSEQTCPLLAKLMAKHFGFKCTVLFGINDQGHIHPGAKSVPHTEALKDADLLVFFARFMSLPDNQVDDLAQYFERGGPVIGLRTSTHCFNGQDGKWEQMNYKFEDKKYVGGLGEQIFGNTWHKERGQSHYGSNHKMGSRITPISGTSHPTLTGVKSIHGYSGAYLSRPPKDATPLLEVQVLATFDPSDEINEDKPIVNAGWSREMYVAPSGETKKSRVVYTSYGASEDMLSEDGRRFLVNSCLWAGGWESEIKSDLNVDIVGKYNPTPYGNGSYHAVGVTPKDLAGWDSEIMPSAAKLHGVDDPKKAARATRALENRPKLREMLIKLHPELYGPNAKLPKPEAKKKKQPAKKRVPAKA